MTDDRMTIDDHPTILTLHRHAVVERKAPENFNATSPVNQILILVHLGDSFQVPNQVSHSVIPFTIATPGSNARCISYSSMLEASIPTDGHSVHYELEKQITRRRDSEGPIKPGQSMTLLYCAPNDH